MQFTQHSDLCLFSVFNLMSLRHNTMCNNDFLYILVSFYLNYCKSVLWIRWIQWKFRSLNLCIKLFLWKSILFLLSILFSPCGLNFNNVWLADCVLYIFYHRLLRCDEIQRISMHLKLRERTFSFEVWHKIREGIKD